MVKKFCQNSLLEFSCRKTGFHSKICDLGSFGEFDLSCNSVHALEGIDKENSDKAICSNSQEL